MSKIKKVIKRFVKIPRKYKSQIIMKIIDKWKFLKLNKNTVMKLIKTLNKNDIEKYLIKEKIKELPLEKDDILYLISFALISSTEKIETIKKIKKQFYLTNYEIIKLIKLNGNVKEYLTREKISELFCDYNEIEWFGFEIIELVKATGNIDEYINKKTMNEFSLSPRYMAELIRATGNIEKYLTIEKIEDFGLDNYEIKELTRDFDIEKRKKYYFPWQENDSEMFVIAKINIHYLENKEKYTKHILDRIKKLNEKNYKIYEKIDLKFLFNDEFFKEFIEEQIIRITNYPRVQKYFIEAYDNKPLFEAIKYLMKNDTNYIISLDTILSNNREYEDLKEKLRSVDIDTIENKDEFYQNLLNIISNKCNYFNINNFEDIINYQKKKNDFCLGILKGKSEVQIPDDLKEYNQSELYKFALLEYKFGISLEEAKRLITRYGEDSEKLPNNNKISEYLRILKSIIESEEIKEVIDYAIENDLLDEPWCGFPNARNAEGEILNLFEKLYNETLYTVEDNLEDKEDKKELYIEIIKDENGNKKEIKHEIDVYTLKKDFNINVKIEGAYSLSFVACFSDLNSYYNSPDIENHGNCESYIRNDSISIARMGYNCVAVGYGNILPNTLSNAAPYDLSSKNINFSNYNRYNEINESSFRIPDEMINNTRHPHNEMVKERLITDKDGKVVKSKPSFIIWIKEDTIDERNNNKDWINAKKMASQLGVPIVVIDREYFAKRENEKIEIMRKILKGDKAQEYSQKSNFLSQKEYEELIEKYGKLSKPELINKIILKYENNRNGLQSNEKLSKKYFTQGKLNEIFDEFFFDIEELDEKEALDCLQTFYKSVKSEYDKFKYEEEKYKKIHEIFKFKPEIKLDKVDSIDEKLESYKEQSEKIRKKINTLNNSKVNEKEEINNNKIIKNFMNLYIKRSTDIEQVNIVSNNLHAELQITEKDNLEEKSHIDN